MQITVACLSILVAHCLATSVAHSLLIESIEAEGAHREKARTKKENPKDEVKRSREAGLA